MAEAYIRGNTIKYVRVPPEVIDKVQEDAYRKDGAPAARAPKTVKFSVTRRLFSEITIHLRWTHVAH